MKVNFSPINTCNNYGINSFMLDDTKIVDNLCQFDNIYIENLEKLKDDKIIKNQIFDQKNNFFAHFLAKNGQKSKIFFDFDKKNNNLAEQIKIENEANSCGEVIIKYNSSIPSYHNGEIDFCVKSDSRLTSIIYSNFGANSLNMISINLDLAKGSELNLVLVDLACDTSLQSLSCELPNNNSTLNVKTIYMCDGGKADYNYVVDVKGENAKVDMNAIGVLCHQASKDFKGTIVFDKGAKNSVGRERELCLPMSESCISLSSPIILCQEEDVDISHSTSLGKIDDKTMFYMNSRGINSEEAQRIFVKAQLSRMLDDIDDEIKDKIYDSINRIEYEK